MPTLETQPAAELLKAFSHPTRLAILQEGFRRVVTRCDSELWGQPAAKDQDRER